MMRTGTVAFVAAMAACRAGPPIADGSAAPCPDPAEVPAAEPAASKDEASVPDSAMRAMELVRDLASASRRDVYEALPATFRDRVAFDGLDAMLSNIQRTMGPLADVRVAQSVSNPRSHRFIMIAFYERGAKVHAMDFNRVGDLRNYRIRSLPLVEPLPGSEPAEGHVSSLRYSFPLRGQWRVSNGGPRRAKNHHVGSREQWYAFDFIQGKKVETPTQNEDYEAYGEPVVAPADGRVVVVIDGVPETTPGKMDEHMPFGNLIIIDHGSGEFSYLAHLQPGSVRVKPGKRVVRGQEIGRVGNSGRSTEPHLHWHVATESLPAGGHGLPIRFRALMVNGELVDEPALVRGDVVQERP